ncbi:MAG: hypothetical protein U9R36_00370, partial [Elusimicrobiota bacterium]|nr:hypothetical protein [Elusimicrobiota bacterium]
KALTFTEEIPGPYSNLGYIYLQRKDFSEAARTYRRATEVLRAEMAEYTRKEHFKGRIARQYNNLGAVYEKEYRARGDEKYFDLAEKSYEKAIEFEKAFSQAYFNRGVLYWNRDWEKAARNFRLAAEYDPANQSALRYYNLAREKAQNLRKRP